MKDYSHTGKWRGFCKCPRCGREDMLWESETCGDGEVTVSTASCYCGYSDGDAA